MEYFYIIKIFLDPLIILPSVLIGIILSFITFYFLKRTRTEFLVKDGLRMSKWFLVGGEESDYYYDIDKSSKTLEGMEKISKWYIDNINEINKKDGIDGLAFIERDDGPVGAITKKDLISLRTNIPSFVVRPKRRIWASVVKGTDSSLKGKKVAIISDVATTGKSINNVVEILENYQAKVVAAITILNRGGVETKKLLKNKSIEFRYGTEKKDLDKYWPKNDS